MSLSNLSFEELEQLANEPVPSAEEGKDIAKLDDRVLLSHNTSSPSISAKALDTNVSNELPSSAERRISSADRAAEESYATDQLLSDSDSKELLEKTLMFDTYIDLLSFFHSSVRESKINLHLWQMDVGNLISTTPASIENPFKFVLCASNGSGKDSFCIAPLAIWFILCKLKSRVVITSSSGVQLTAQTETYIRNLAETINTFLTELGAPKAFKINQRYIRCLYTGSEIRMYATDEPGKAEGYHPMEPNAPFLIIVNEAKSVSEEIFSAISRCTGFSHKVYVSSPGEPKGALYFAFNHWEHTRRVSSYDCTHIPRKEIEQDMLEFGEHSALFRSKHLALFTSIGGSVVLNDDVIKKCKELSKSRIGAHWPKRVGIDLAAGGDECVINISQGNKTIYTKCFVEKDTTISADIIDRELTKQGISKDSSYIRADDGGVGRGIIDQLARSQDDGGLYGWTIQRVLNQSAARDKRMYGNRGAEMWFRFSRLVETCLWLLPVEDQKCMDQLAARHYRQSTGGNNRLFLQDKKESKAEGYPSPDRADALILANWDISVEDLLKENGTEESSNKSPSKVTIEDIVKLHDQQKYGYVNATVRDQFYNAHLVRWSTAPDFISEKPPQPRSHTIAAFSLSEHLN